MNPGIHKTGLLTMKSETVYYLPGHGGRLETGLGEALMSRGFNVAGRQTIGDFKAIPFSDQIAIIAEDLTNNYWREGARVIANSFGFHLLWGSFQTKTSEWGSSLLTPGDWRKMRKMEHTRHHCTAKFM